MSTANHDQREGNAWGSIDGSSLTVAAAHDLSAPLVLLRQLGLAVAATDGSNDEERHMLGRQLTLTSERALRMVASLSMTSADQQQLELEPINPMSICQDVVHELSPLFAAHGQKLTLQPRSRIPLLVGNRRLLQQILLGFGDNALYYGSDTHPIHMHITARGNKVRIGIRDYGPAVPADMWQRIENRVGQHAPMPLATRPHISAVSLVAAKRLAELMNSAVGTIRHKDGVTFYVDLHTSGQMSLL